MNILQYYQWYLSIPLKKRGNESRIYPDYVVLTGRSFAGPHPHRHYTFEEFVDKFDDDFRNVLLSGCPNWVRG